MTDTAALANEVESTLENALETIADPAIAAAAQETFVSAEEAIGHLRGALAGAVQELRDHADRRQAAVDDGGSPAADHAAEVAAELRQLADRLDEPGAWQTVDRVVHELVSDLLVGALALAQRAPSAAVTARAVAIGVLAGRDAIWSGAGPRLGCAYDFGGLLALVRTTARAA